jgi:hypothetical protein
MEETGDDGWVITTEGGDPYVFAEAITAKYDPSTFCVFSFEYFCPKGLDLFQLHYGPPITARNRADGPGVPPAEGWVPYALDIGLAAGNWGEGFTLLRSDLGTRPGVEIRVRNVRLRARTPEEAERVRTMEARRRRDARREVGLASYLARRFPCALERVEVGRDTVTVSGSAPAGERGIVLAELKPHRHVADLRSVDSTREVRVDGVRFSLKTERFVRGPARTYDRAYSRWAVVESAEGAPVLRSRARWADVVPSRVHAPRPRARTKKGVTGARWRGGAVSDIADLGAGHVTVNVVVNAFACPATRPGAIPFEFGGGTWHVAPGPVDALDRVTKFARENAITVTGIILVTRGKGRERNVFAHPDARDPGIYAMPDVTSPEGVERYAAVLEFLAERYSREDGSRGLIANWIVHNEIDAGWVWTNAGEKELLGYMDLYHRSMRLAYIAARKYRSSARTFVPLTHWWTETHGAHCYAGRDVLLALDRLGKAEGDFEWGVAYHPYPEDLRNPRTWEDRKSPFAFDAPQITFRNIEVLDAYMRRPEMRYLGRKVRGVLLSEQGLNSPDYSEESLALQAAGLVYAWHKVKDLDSIEAFHYHRWVDHEREGGLRLGLWTVEPGTVNKRGRKKPAWHVWRAMGTPEEARASEFAKALIGTGAFSEVSYRGKIE